jgi:hypothetical protein
MQAKTLTVKTKPTAMIQSFADKDTEELFQRETNRRFNAVNAIRYTHEATHHTR